MSAVRIGKIFSLMLLFIFAGLNMATPGYSSISVSATLDSHQFPADRTAVLTITADGGRSVDINIPEVKNLRFHFRKQYEKFRWINGSISASISIVYLVEPLVPGQYTIPPILVHCDGKELFTKPLAFEATAGTPQPNRSTGTTPPSTKSRLGRGDADKIAFMRIHPDKESIYPGEMVPIHIDLYISNKIRANEISLPTLKGDGFVLNPLGDKPHRSMKTINTGRYIVLSWDSYLTGIKEGQHKLSFELEAELLMPQRSRMFSRFRNQGYMHDDFFSDFFQDYQSKTVKITSPELLIETLPLPVKNRPKDFAGAVGHFNLEVTATPTKLAVGEPITLSMAIEGTGNFDRVNECTFPESKQWKQYTPSVEFQPEAGRPNRGVKRFEQAIVPRDTTISEIPSITFSYFDPATGQYKRLTSEPIPLTIQEDQPQETTTAADSNPKDIGRTHESASLVQTDNDGLAPIKLEVGHLQESIKPLFHKAWFISLMILCTCLLCCLFFIRLNRRRYENNPELQHRTRMKKLLLLRLSEIKQAGDLQDSNAFLAACRLAIQEQLGLVWSVEGTAITLADLEKKLDPDSNLIPIFSMADQAAYSSHALSVEEIQHLYRQLKDELVKLS